MRLFLSLLMLALFCIPAQAKHHHRHHHRHHHHHRHVAHHPRQAPAPVVVEATGKAKTAMASVYWEGSKTASGEPFRPHALTVAHKSLPFGTNLKITNPRNGRSVEARVNDRGPFIRGRTYDLSLGTANAIGFSGVGQIIVEILRAVFD